MKRLNIIKLLVFLVVVFVFSGSSIFAESETEDYKLFTQSLDAISGTASCTDFSLRIGSGGQPGVIGTSQGKSFYGFQGYVNTAAFVHGDVNADGNVTVADVIYLINYIFKTGSEPIPLETGDVDGDNLSQIQDAVYLVIYLFKGGPKPCNL